MALYSVAFYGIIKNCATYSILSVAETLDRGLSFSREACGGFPFPSSPMVFLL